MGMIMKMGNRGSLRKGENLMVRNGICAMGASFLLLVCQPLVLSQEPPKLEPPSTAPSATQIPADDPVMRAILERSLPLPIPPPSIESGSAQSVRSVKPDARWRIAERLLKQARLLERDAESIEALGDEDTAKELRKLAQGTRNQVLRLFKSLEIKSLP